MEPGEDENGLPLHRDECKEYDGKRCKLTGFRPDRFCEPKLIEVFEDLKELRWRSLTQRLAEHTTHKET